jgi:type I restriction enzyme S subunit
MQNNTPMVKLGTILKQKGENERVEAEKSYKLLGVRLEGNGAFIREEKLGVQIAAPHLKKVRSGDFIYSRLFAWRGAFGLIPDSLDGSYVSNEFPLFIIDTNKIVPRYLEFYFNQKRIWMEVEKYCMGTTKASRNRFKENFFLNFVIPLPSIEEQQHIVVTLERLIAKIEEARQQQIGAISRADSIINSTIEKTVFSNSYPYTLFEKLLADAKNGIYKSPAFLGTGIPCIRMFNIQNGTITFSDIVLIDVTETEIQNYHCRTGDIIFNRVNSRELVGKTGLVPENSPKCVFESKNIRLRVKEELILPKFFVYVINAPQSRKYFMNVLKQQCGQATLNRKHLNRLAIPLPTIPEQHLIIAHLDRLQAKVDEAKRLQRETEREMGALVPALLAKVFQRE